MMIQVLMVRINSMWMKNAVVTKQILVVRLFNPGLSFGNHSKSKGTDQVCESVVN